jgi:hypothetical protein
MSTESGMNAITASAVAHRRTTSAGGSVSGV